MITPTLTTNVFESIFHSLSCSNQRHRDIAREVRCRNLGLLNHARYKAVRIGLSIDVEAAVNCPQNQVAVLPLPVIDTTPSPCMGSYFSPITPLSNPENLPAFEQSIIVQARNTPILRSIGDSMPTDVCPSPLESPLISASILSSPMNTSLQGLNKSMKSDLFGSLKINIPTTPTRFGSCVIQANSSPCQITRPLSSSISSAESPNTPEIAKRVTFTLNQAPQKRENGVIDLIDESFRDRWFNRCGYATRDAIQIYL